MTKSNKHTTPRLTSNGWSGTQLDPKTTERKASTPYVNGLNVDAIRSHSGTPAPETGNNAPLKKNRGRLMKVCIAPKLSKLPIALAIVNPILTSPNVMRSIMGKQIKKVIGSKATPSNEPRAKTIMP